MVKEYLRHCTHCTHCTLTCGEGILEADYEGMTDGLEDPVLRQRVLHLVLLEDEVLLEDLHGVHPPRGLLATQDNLAESSPAEDLEELEVLHGDLVLAVPRPLLLLTHHGDGGEHHGGGAGETVPGE